MCAFAWHHFACRGMQCPVLISMCSMYSCAASSRPRRRRRINMKRRGANVASTEIGQMTINRAAAGARAKNLLL